MKLERRWAMPNKHTFSIPPIRVLLEHEIPTGIIIDPYANEALYPEINDATYITNDLNPDYNTNHHMDALDFLRMFDDTSVDCILFDPPYSTRQVAECYHNVGRETNMQTFQNSFWTRQKQEIQRIVKPGGKVISFGWNSGGIGIKYGFAKKRILLVPHGGHHNDTICVVEEKK